MYRLVVVAAYVCVFFIEYSTQRVPFYCKRVRVNCVKSPSHACCADYVPEETTETIISSTKPPDVNEELNEESSQDNQNEDLLEKVKESVKEEEVVVVVEEEEEEELVVENIEDIIERLDDDEDGDGDDLDTGEEDPYQAYAEDEILDSAPSQIDEVIIDPKLNSVITTARPEKFAPKFCLVLKFNCQLRKTHPCCKYPLPPKDAEKQDPPQQVEPKSKRPGVRLPSPTLATSNKPSSTKRPSFLRPNPFSSRRPALEKKTTIKSSPNQGQDDQEKTQNKSETRLQRPTSRPNILRRASTTTQPTTTTSTQSSISSLFRRPGGRPNLSKNRLSALASFRSRSKICNKIAVDCKRSPSHTCCNKSSESGNSDENDEKKNDPQSLSDKNQSTTIKTSQVETTSTTVSPEIQKDSVTASRPNSQGDASNFALTDRDSSTSVPTLSGGLSKQSSQSNEGLNIAENVGVVDAADPLEEEVEDGFEAVVSKVSSVSSTETRLVQTAPIRQEGQNKDVGSTTVPVDKPNMTEKEVASSTESTTPSSSSPTSQDSSTVTTTTGTTTTAKVSTVQAQDSTATSIKNTDKDDEMPLFHEEPEHMSKVSPAKTEVSKGDSTESSDYEYVYYTTGDGGEEGEYYYVYEYETPTTRPPSLQPVFVPESSTEVKRGGGLETVLDLNQIVPRIQGECFRFDCSSAPADHHCCARKSTKKRQISDVPESYLNIELPKFSLSQLTKLNANQEYPARVTATVTRIEKSINWGDASR